MRRLPSFALTSRCVTCTLSCFSGGTVNAQLVQLPAWSHAQSGLLFFWLAQTELARALKFKNIDLLCPSKCAIIFF